MSIPKRNVNDTFARGKDDVVDSATKRFDYVQAMKEAIENPYGFGTHTHTSTAGGTQFKDEYTSDPLSKSVTNRATMILEGYEYTMQFCPRCKVDKLMGKRTSRLSWNIKCPSCDLQSEVRKI